MPSGPISRYRHIAIAIVAVIFSTAIPSSRAAEIAWLDSPQQAAQVSRQLDLPVIMYITSDHCGYCRKMEQESWVNHDIAKMVEEGFVPLKVHASRHAELVTALGVRAFPTTILFSPQAKPIGGSAGYLTPPRLAALLREAALPQPAATHGLVAHTGDAVDAIAWHHTAQTAFQISEQSRRPVLIYVSSEQCTYCRKMENETWSAPEISSLVQAGYVPLSLKAESDTELIAALNVKAYPTTIVVSPERKVIAGVAGYVPVTGVVELLKNGDPQGIRPARLPVPVASR